jgi:uncharacterized protein (TIGR02466 family)
MPIEHFFPKIFYYKDAIVSKSENCVLIAETGRLRADFPVSTRDNLYTTYGSVANVLARAEFASLRAAIATAVQEYLTHLDTRDGTRYVISDSWVSISGPGDHERMHTHDGAYVSGVYYLQTTPNCGNLYFEELQDNLWASNRSKPELFNTVSYIPVERRLILFNSRIPHHVGRNRSTAERIALSCNIALL